MLDHAATDLWPRMRARSDKCQEMQTGQKYVQFLVCRVYFSVNAFKDFGCHHLVVPSASSKGLEKAGLEAEALENHGLMAIENCSYEYQVLESGADDEYDPGGRTSGPGTASGMSGNESSA